MSGLVLPRPDGDDPAPEHTEALVRLLLCGWQSAPCGDRSAPVAIIFTRAYGLGIDIVYVQGHDSARAIRQPAVGPVSREARGTCAEVVEAVLDW